MIPFKKRKRIIKHYKTCFHAIESFQENLFARPHEDIYARGLLNAFYLSITRMTSKQKEIFLLFFIVASIISQRGIASRPETFRFCCFRSDQQ